jgi:rhodanese-related sulfurtransferase
MIPQITPKELAAKLKSAAPPLVVDVREPYEYEYCRIAGALLKPLGDILRWAPELDQNAEIVLQCHTGSRSAQATQVLSRLGFKHVKNLAGGIDAWSAQVDPNVPRY